MSKKAAEVVEAAPKFKQPWQGLLSFLSILILAYVTYTWFLHPVWGLLTRMITSNAFVAYWVLESLGYGNIGQFGIIASLNNPNYMEVYPLGYLTNWASYFIFCIVWFVSIALLARPFTPSTSKLRKQPWQGLAVLVLSMVLAFITWYILGVLFKWKAMEMIVLGTCGFLIFPVWVTMFGYWPIFPKRMGMNALVRGVIFITLSWVLTFVLRGIIAMMIWSNSIAVVGTQYYLLNPLQPLTPTEPYYFWISIVLSLIVGVTVISQLNLFPTMNQPIRGIVNFSIAIVLGLIMWTIIRTAIGPSYQSVLLTTMLDTLTPAATLVTFPYINHGAVAAYLAFPLLILLAEQFTFQMWPWSRWTKWGNLIGVIMAFIIGTIVFIVMMAVPGFASQITGANMLTSTSGLQAIYLFPWGLVILFVALLGLVLPIPIYQIVPFMFTYTATALYFEGLAAYLGQSLMATWVLTVFIFYLLIYEGFEHWPWK
jgi:hypothetical protein